MANGEPAKTNQNAWIAAGVVLIMAIVALLLVRLFSPRDTRPLSLPGELTAGQVETLKTLAARAEAMHTNAGELPTLTASQSQTLEGLTNNQNQ